MSSSQKVAIWAAVFAISATGLYPPWVHIVRQGRYYSYGWLFKPPELELDAGWRTELDVTRLLIEWAVICVLAAAMFWAPLDVLWLRRRRARSDAVQRDTRGEGRAPTEEAEPPSRAVGRERRCLNCGARVGDGTALCYECRTQGR